MAFYDMIAWCLHDISFENAIAPISLLELKASKARLPWKGQIRRNLAAAIRFVLESNENGPEGPLTHCLLEEHASIPVVRTE